MTYGRDVDWARNFVAAGGGEIERMGRRFRVSHPRIVGTQAASPDPPAAVRPVFKLADFPSCVLLESGKTAKAAAKPRRRR